VAYRRRERREGAGGLGLLTFASGLRLLLDLLGGGHKIIVTRLLPSPLVIGADV